MLRKVRSTLFFLLGFLFDVYTLGRIDSPWNILRQGVFLVLGTAFHFSEWVRPGDAGLFKYRRSAVQFFLGSLLSAYTIFYFKSASLFTSIGFILLLSTLLILNEYKVFQKALDERSETTGMQMRSTLLGLCWTSYCVYLIPIIIGGVGQIPFILSMTAASFLFLILGWIALKLRPGESRIVQKQLHLPWFGVILTFTVFYFLRAIPPVPLAIQHMGIYSGIKKEGGQYLLSFHRAPDDPHSVWNRWFGGEPTFPARPGDAIYFFTRVYSPTRIQDELVLHWLKQDPKRGWLTSDRVPLPITGGRKEGFRGYSYKTNYTPGHWRVQVETPNGSELGRYYFKIVADSSTDERLFEVEKH